MITENAFVMPSSTAALGTGLLNDTSVVMDLLKIKLGRELGIEVGPTLGVVDHDGMDDGVVEGEALFFLFFSFFEP